VPEQPSIPPGGRAPEDLAADAASQQLIAKSVADGVATCFSRYETQKHRCKFGVEGLCCRICHMGPCRITKKSPRGVCGADEHTIAARNFLREVADAWLIAIWAASPRRWSRRPRCRWRR